MRRRVFLGLVLAAGLLPVAVPAGEVATLQERLETGLKARLPSEFAFIARVVQLVREGTLPLPLVNSTFLWARQKPQNQVQYFARALRSQAAKLGVSL